MTIILMYKNAASVLSLTLIISKGIYCVTTDTIKDQIQKMFTKAN